MNVLFDPLFLLLLLLLVWLVVEHITMKNNATSKVIGRLLAYFSIKGDQVIEFRITKEKAFRKKREFQVKTIRRNFYIVNMDGVEVVSISKIAEMTISRVDAYLIGEVDPTNLDEYELFVKGEARNQ